MLWKRDNNFVQCAHAIDWRREPNFKTRVRRRIDKNKKEDDRIDISYIYVIASFVSYNIQLMQDKDLKSYKEEDGSI